MHAAVHQLLFHRSVGEHSANGDVGSNLHSCYRVQCQYRGTGRDPYSDIRPSMRQLRRRPIHQWRCVRASSTVPSRHVFVSATDGHVQPCLRSDNPMHLHPVRTHSPDCNDRQGLRDATDMQWTFFGCHGRDADIGDDVSGSMHTLWIDPGSRHERRWLRIVHSRCTVLLLLAGHHSIDRLDLHPDEPTQRVGNRSRWMGSHAPEQAGGVGRGCGRSGSSSRANAHRSRSPGQPTGFLRCLAAGHALGAPRSAKPLSDAVVAAHASQR